jgi:hypothetical protein
MPADRARDGASSAPAEASADDAADRLRALRALGGASESPPAPAREKEHAGRPASAEQGESPRPAPAPGGGIIFRSLQRSLETAGVQTTPWVPPAAPPVRTLRVEVQVAPARGPASAPASQPTGGGP